MPRRRKRTSPIASDEEDVDGDLSEASSMSDTESTPANEAVYLPEEENSNLIPEENETDNQLLDQENKPSGPIIKVKTIDSLRETSETEVEKTDKSSSSTNQSSKNNSGNKHPSLKVGNKGCIKKAKYARQATPICDAIMREYSRRQRLMKQKGITDPSALGDMNIKELLKKAKENLMKKKNNTENETEVIAESANDEDSVSEEDSEDDDDLPVIKQEIIDTKPEVIDTSLTFSTVKKEKDESVDSSTVTLAKSSPGPKRGRPRARVVKKKRKRLQESDEDDDSDEDPDFDPTETRTVAMNKRATRSKRLRNDTPENEDNTCNVQDKESGDNESENSLPTPQEQVINVAERLKSLAEKIADVLTKDPSPNINSEAENLLKTTQELIKLQKKKLENSKSSYESLVNIKEEIPEDSPENDVVSNGVIVNQSNSIVLSSENSGHSLQIYNQLQIHEAALQKKISAGRANKDNLENNSPAMIPTNLPSIENVLPGPVSIKEKCTFILDFFTSYQAVFDEYTLHCVIGELSDNLMIFINEFSQYIKISEEADSFKDKAQRQNKISAAKKAYLKTVMNSRKKFLPVFKHVVNNIIKTRTSKALINTLLLYVAGSLYIKRQEIIKDKIHRLRRVLAFVTNAYQYHHKLVTEVLTSPNDVFDNETTLVRRLLTYFQARKFLKIPSELLSYYPELGVEEEQQFQADLSLLDPAILKQSNSSVNGVENVQNQDGYGQPAGTNYLLRRPSIAAEFVKSLENEPDENTKSIEEKLGNLLDALSSRGKNIKIEKDLDMSPQLSCDKELSGPKKSSANTNLNVRVNLGAKLPNIKTVKFSSYKDPTSSVEPGDKETALVQLLENDHVGLDSLFSSYLKASSIKSEPEDVNIAFVANEEALVKMEPEETVSTQMIQTQPAMDSLDKQSVTTICEDGFTEEYNFAKKEEESFAV